METTQDEPESMGPSIQRLLVEACTRNNVDLINEVLQDLDDVEAALYLNSTTDFLGNHLYHIAASHDQIIDFLLDQPYFECDPISEEDGDSPLHTVVRWINGQNRTESDFHLALVEMMLEAGSDPSVRNYGGLTPLELVDPQNDELRELLRHAQQTSGNPPGFVAVEDLTIVGDLTNGVEEDENAEFSGSDEEERAEWERQQQEKEN